MEKISIKWVKHFTGMQDTDSVWEWLNLPTCGQEKCEDDLHAAELERLKEHQSICNQAAERYN